MNRDLCWFWFSSLCKTGIKTRHRLLEVYGDAQAIFLAPAKQLQKLEWLSEGMRQEIVETRSPECIKQAYDNYNMKEYNFVHMHSNAYPQRLKNIYDYPTGLFYKGHLPNDNRASVAIVGARYCTMQGKARAYRFAKVMADAGIQIISGMALGIDGSVHRGAIDVKGSTYAVLGNGIDICYPRENWEIYYEIPYSGGCLSEYPPGDKPVSWHFPMRNRIIAGLSDVIIVVEAREKSGALITADYGLEQGKDVFVVPGRPEDELSRGCNALISEGAGLVSEPEEILDHLGIGKGKNKKNNIALAKSEKLVYSTLCLIPKNVEDVCREVRMDINEVFLALHTLEQKGVIRQVHRNSYILN